MLALSGLTVYLAMTVLLGQTGLTFVPALATLGVAGLAVRWRLHRRPAFLAVWLGVSAAFAVFSALSGFYNGLTDEAVATPAFASQFWPNLYALPLHRTYFQYGSGPYHLSAYYVYLPLLTLVQVPGLDYRWVSLVGWAAAVVLLRRYPAAVVVWGSSYVALLAANGFNDFVPLALLTLAFVPASGWAGWVAQGLSLGLKQFANVFVVIYHLYRRRWRSAIVAVVVTAAFLAPFLLTDPLGTWCHAFLVSGMACSSFPESFSVGLGSGAPPVYSHMNYFLWPLWLVGLFAPRWAERARGPGYESVRRRAAAWLRRGSRHDARPPDEFTVLLVAWWLDLRPHRAGATRPPVR